ncbi:MULTISPECIES: TetR/AcrR family transcriptional regulator [Rhodococcus]|jgi:AcrR family transcriptional regulator|uniref:TetR/AcrR family transcriptional regulator n=1 Tax=Rhodococcus aetherivorans TaxID=191292 RepID=A0AA46NYL6_9NOCA|nr:MULTISPECIES: TetR/AcrR family transcriptional regulator [Rhodococcus]ANZ25459.1 TetR family transcriptional regulator [Rhodococcus sp. WB1]MBC2587293.1 TetR/AcrR family transcriptional regulator [Rhodococcus aetherivorans]QRI74616.1 TetR/AcrR family transcriptional regulator [Rhodococcus aetherivorans]QSE58027.1 TetR/AcrR family transcriptional regulator [Rhodococcus sp. PSBB066]QSE70644.1 TetR/AcrR family transcriptional regulator [Rhodococcus sp. PSBB049]
MSIRNDEIRSSGPPAATVENQILDATRSCLLDFGLRRTTLAEVARRAGVSRPTVYRRWPDTRALVADLLTREIRAVLPDLREEGPVRPRVVRAVVTAVDEIGTHPLFEKILRSDPDLLMTYIVDRLGTSQHAVLEVLTGALVLGQRDGTVRAGDVRALAAFVLLTAQSVVQSAGMVTEVVDRAALLAELAHAVDTYLAPSGEDRP